MMRTTDASALSVATRIYAEEKKSKEIEALARENVSQEARHKGQKA